MMFHKILTLHSTGRWFLLLVLVYSLYQSAIKYHKHRPYNKNSRILNQGLFIIALLQLTLGLWLYRISPLIYYFLNNYKDAVHQRSIRFFGMEHSLMMLVSVMLILIGNRKAVQQKQDLMKHRSLVIWYSIALIIIIINIPWPFSPFASRPLIRWF